MEQKSIFKSSVWKVFEIFIDEPLKIHYVKEISGKISLAPTSVKKHLIDLENHRIVLRKKGERFEGYVASRDESEFLFYKKMFNLIKIKESGLLEHIANSLYPNAIILYGSYSGGEDVEGSDIDLMVIAKSKKSVSVEKYEKILKRKVHIITEENLNKLNANLKSEVINGIILYGYLKDGR